MHTNVLGAHTRQKQINRSKLGMFASLSFFRYVDLLRVQEEGIPVRSLLAAT